MSSILVFVLAIFLIAEISADQAQCNQLADCFRNANAEMSACTPKVNAIDITKLQGTDFDQCSHSKPKQKILS